jgi:hypothetical protein
VLEFKPFASVDAELLIVTGKASWEGVGNLCELPGRCSWWLRLSSTDCLLPFPAVLPASEADHWASSILVAPA